MFESSLLLEESWIGCLGNEEKYELYKILGICLAGRIGTFYSNFEFRDLGFIICILK